jgi:Ca2+-binding EF-hand superfamily protein
LHSINFSKDSDVRYGEFLLQYGGKVPDLRRKPKSAKPNGDVVAPTVHGSRKARKPDGIDAKLQASLAQSHQQIKLTMRGRDWKNSGTLAAAEFIKVLRGFNAKLDAEESLWLAQRWAVNADGTGPVKWIEFLRFYARRPKAASVDASVKLALLTTRADRHRGGSAMRMSQDSVFNKIRKVVLPKWTAIRRACVKKDPKPTNGGQRSGYIPAADFRQILASHGIVFDTETFYHIHSAVDRELRRGVKYNVFFDLLIRQQ